MPSRVVDGEAVWTSKKLRKIPEKYRLHYANWLPLAEANGTFEFDYEMIWSRVYAYLCPEITPEIVKEIAEIFVDAGLIYKWKEQGKTWGYFRGMEKPGRLPAKTHQDRYKNLPPSVPERSGIVPDNPGEVGNSPEGFGIGIGSGIGKGIGSGVGDRQVSSKIRELCLTLLDKEAEPERHYKQKLGDLVRKQGAGNGWKVSEAFEHWAGDTAVSGAIPDYPVSKFLATAKGYLSVVSADKAESAAAAPGIITNLLNQLALETDAKVTFGESAKPIFSMWLRDYSETEIIQAFRYFYQQITDENGLKWAAKEFVDKGLQILYTLRKQRLDAEAQDRSVSEQIEIDRAQVAADLAAIAAQEAEEDALVELKPPVEEEPLAKNAADNGTLGV
jgi:hypothetical protein